MDSIKKFFDKKKKDAKFKMAGDGKRLTDASSHSSKSKPQSSQGRCTPSNEAQRAGAAALARFENVGPTQVDWSLQAIKAQAKRELEAEKKLLEMNLASAETSDRQLTGPKEVRMEAAPMLAVQGVYFHCPLLGPEVDTYEEIKARIRSFLFQQLGDDKGVASCLIIRTCNKNKDKVQSCVETLCKYIENIVSNPEEPKYRKIRVSNRAFQDRVSVVEGAREFLEAAGFELQELPFNDTKESFWVYPDENMDNLSSLENLRDTLVSAEPLKPQLDRSLQVLLPREASQFKDLPPEFFALSVEELKKEMQQRSDATERSQMLMTKAMREKMELREIRKYRFSLIRIRFPDGIILQGTFAVNEKFESVREFVRQHLVNDWRPFALTLSGGGKIDTEDSSLFDLHLVPAILLNFEWDLSIQDPNLDDRILLKEEILMLRRETTG